jgi:exopolyphosphatase/guanosine-5'-triphosphate,3'-diphosphate pyrophosphatase
MIYALIDVGSNTIRMNLYKCEEGQAKLLFGTKNSAGLIGYVENGMMSLKGAKKATSVLSEFKEMLENFDIEKLFVFATASLRNIKNSKETMAYIEEKTGLTIDLISGEYEAKLDFIGATKVVDIADGLIVDIGGGSTELVTFRKKEIIEAFSMPIGSLNLYKEYVSGLLPTKKEKKQIKERIHEELDKISCVTGTAYTTICGVGGTIRAAKKLNNALFDLPESNNQIGTKNIKQILKHLSHPSKESVNTILQVSPERIHTVIPGMLILREVCKYFGSECIVVSNYGVREGYLYDKVLKND